MSKHSLNILMQSALQSLVVLFILPLLFGCDAASYVKKGNKAKAIGEYFLAADYYLPVHTARLLPPRSSCAESGPC